MVNLKGRRGAVYGESIGVRNRMMVTVVAQTYGKSVRH